jgi:hypothetical protein
MKKISRQNVYSEEGTLLSSSYPTKFVESFMHEGSVKEIKQINSNGRFPGVVFNLYCKGVPEEYRRIFYLYKTQIDE